MADNLLGEVPLELQPQMQDITQQQKLSQMLLQQGMQQPQGQMVSGHYVRPSILQSLNPLFSAYAGAKGMENAEQKQLDLAKAIRTQGDAAAADVMNTYKTDPNAALQKALQYQQFPQVKAVLPQLSKTAMPEQTTNMQEFQEAMKNPQFAQYVKDMKLLGRNLTTVNMPPVESAYNKTFGEGIATQDLALKANADTAQNTVANIGRQRQILDSGKFFAGPAANAQQAVANYGTALGVGGKDTAEKVANTQSLISGGAGVTLDNIKGSGLGAGQGFTDKDLQFLQDAKSYRITMNEPNIRRVLDLQEKAAIESAKKWNTRQSQIQKSATGPINVGPVAIPQSNVVDYNSLK